VIDVSRQLSAVRRQVGRRVLEAGEVRVVTIAQTYDASVEDVWEACTSAERLPRWFLPVTGDLHVGGRYQLVGNAGGTIERCDPPHVLAATWEHGGNVSWIELRLTAEDDERTRWELDHLFPLDDPKWEEFGPGAVGVGWDLALPGLASHLATRAPVDRDAGMAWVASDEGRRFIALSSRAWRDANVAAGADGAAADAAEQRTTAAYAGM
jgi:uncharacterized protein YndB with AHSA1/START domain